MILSRQEMQELMGVAYRYLCPSNAPHFAKGLQELGFKFIKMTGQGKTATYEIEPLDNANIKGEIWKEFPMAPGYLVSNMGRIKNPKGGLLPGYTHRGYIRTRIADLGQLANHRIVMLTFCPIENPELFVVDHINGVRNDNRVENLRWVFQSDNNKLKDQNYSSINEIVAQLIAQYGYEETRVKLSLLLKEQN